MNLTKERQEIKLSILSYVHSETQPYFILTISHCNYSTCFLLSPFFPFLENFLSFLNKMSEVMWYILPLHLSSLHGSSPVPSPIFCPFSLLIAKYSFPISIPQPIHLISFFPDSSKICQSIIKPLPSLPPSPEAPLLPSTNMFIFPFKKKKEEKTKDFLSH